MNIFIEFIKDALHNSPPPTKYGVFHNVISLVLKIFMFHVQDALKNQVFGSGTQWHETLSEDSWHNVKQLDECN